MPRRVEKEQEMNRRRTLKRASILSAVLGAGIALFWEAVVGALIQGGNISEFWYVMMYVTCIPIRLVFVAWWLVPMLNAAIYALFVYVISKTAWRFSALQLNGGWAALPFLFFSRLWVPHPLRRARVCVVRLEQRVGIHSRA